jgi:4a-hydroxytetrahydrobiopterin dehydratase
MQCFSFEKIAKCSKKCISSITLVSIWYHKYMQMSGDLIQKKCVPCEGGVKPLTPDEYGAYLRTKLTGWSDKDAKAIEKEYTFKDFMDALAFVNKVGALAEEEGHHPDITLHAWNKVRLTLSTHAIGGLSENDFILALKIDAD